jgi:hypothetical protein
MDAIVEILHFSGVTAVRAGQLFKKLIVLPPFVCQPGNHIIQKVQFQQCRMNRNCPDAGGVFDFLLALLVGFYPQTGKTVYHANIIQIQLADFIQIFKDNGAPIILRPFLEMNGSWCWYSMLYKDTDGIMKKYPAEYIHKLWIDLYNYLVVERGFDNLIWVYSPNMANRAPNDEVGICTVMYCYPGDEYVDIVGVDWYPGAKDQKDPIKMVNAYEDMVPATGKIFVYGELSAGTENRTVGDNYTFTATDYGNLLKLYAENGVKSAYTLTWSSWDTDEGRVKLTIYEMGNGKEFYAENPGFLDKAATRELLYG